MPTSFHVNAADLAHILKQIQIAELHAGTNGTPMSLVDAIAQVYGLSPTDAALAPFGLRTVDGSYNNLLAGQTDYGAADNPFPRLLDPVWINDTDGDSLDFNGPAPGGVVSNGNYGAPGTVIDADPRTISNLLANQTVDNPAAVEAWFANPLALDQFAEDHPGFTPVRPGELTDPATQLEITNSDLANIYNQSPDIGLSPGFNAWMTFFGQFFDHGLDLVTKGGNGTVYIPLEADDPLVLGADGILGTADDLPPEMRFMALTRATVTYDANGVPQAENTTTPFVDQNQTYTSHPSHQVFLREYVRMDVGDGMKTYNTGHLLDGTTASGSLNGSIANWGEIKQNAIDFLGLMMNDDFVGSAPLLATDQYGNFIPGANGYAQVAVQVIETDGVTETVRNLFVEGVAGGLDLSNIAAAITPTPGLSIVSAQVIPTNHQFLVDIAHHAAPGFVDHDHNPATPKVKLVEDFDMLDANGDGVSDENDVIALGSALTDANNDGVVDALDLADVNLDGVINGADLVADDHNALTYDDEMLDSHYVTGDGRGNENIALTTVHTVFHSEHNRLVEEYKHTIIETAAGGDVTFLNEWLLVDVTEVPADLSTLVWDGARLFQAGRFVTEMQYQHLVFEEFARAIQPNVDPFVFTNDPTIDPDIIAEFAHTVYRFGHSMLGDTVETLDNNLNGTSTSLIDAFLNPQMFVASGADLNEVVANIVRGSAYDLGNEIDEFVVPELQTNLLGLPLDLAALNIARGRETGIPSLNESRRQLYEAFGVADLKPYVSWYDFGQHLKNPASLLNFLAAYGTHATIVAETTLEGKRSAAAELLGIDIPGFNDETGIPADRVAFLTATGAYAGGSLGGLNDVDLWIGGLAEEKNEFGGMLGSTFNFIFEYQLEHLQTGDRFYYLSRTQGTNILNNLEPNTFTDLVMRNSALGDTYATHLNGSLFMTPDQIFELDRGIAQSGADPVWADPFQQSLDPKTFRDYSGSTQVDVNGVLHDEGVVFRFSGGEHVVVGGTEGDDHVNTDKGIDTLWGDGGNDYLNAGSEADNVFGGSGDDIIEDPFGDDVLRGEGGNDVISAGTGLDLIFGGQGNDFIILGQDDKEGFGEDGDDFVLGGTGNDLVQGGEGSDWLEGGDGFDTIAGDNSELFFNSAIVGHDVAWGQGGDQDYDLESGDDIAFTGAGIQRFEGMFGFDWAIRKYDMSNAVLDMSVPIFTTDQANVLRDRFDLVEGASGWRLDDVILGDDRGQTLGGVVTGALFDQHHLTQEGINRIAGLNEWMGGARETLFGAGATDFYNGNILMGGAGNDTITGRGGNDLMDGDTWLNVRIRIDMGNGVEYTANSMNTVTAIAGTNAGKVMDLDGNIMFGGRSLQSLMLDGTINPGQLSIVREILDDPNAASSNDTAVFRGTLAEYDIEGLVTEGPNNSGAILVMAHDVDGDGWISVRDRDDGITGATIVGPDGLPLTLNSRNILTDGTDLIRNFENLQFSDTTLILGGAFNYINGTDGDDVLDGTFFADWMRGFAGNDILRGQDDNDVLEGDGGNDTLTGFGGDDTLFGGTGNDILRGLSGVDTLYGGAGADQLNSGGQVGDRMIGGDGSDIYTVTNTNEQVIEELGGGTDQVRSFANYTLTDNVERLTLAGTALIGTGNDIDNVIWGNTQANTLSGMGGRDVIAGYAGDDTISGGNGDDRLLGLGGADTLRGDAGDDVILGGIGNDRIIQAGSTDGRDIINGETGIDTYQLDATAGDTYVIYTRAEAIAAGITAINPGAEIVITRNGNTNANIIALLDNIEEIVINSVTVSSPGGVAPNTGAGAVGGATVSVVGDFTQTSLDYNTITVNGGAGNDTVDISGLTSAHRLVFTSNGGSDQVIGNLRPQDVVDFAAQPTVSEAPVQSSFIEEPDHDGSNGYRLHNWGSLDTGIHWVYDLM